MDFKDLTAEQQEKAKACTSPAELVELAKAEGYELSDDELDAVSGGSDWYCSGVCPENKVCHVD